MKFQIDIHQWVSPVFKIYGYKNSILNESKILQQELLKIHHKFFLRSRILVFIHEFKKLFPFPFNSHLEENFSFLRCSDRNAENNSKKEYEYTCKVLTRAESVNVSVRIEEKRKITFEGICIQTLLKSKKRKIIIIIAIIKQNRKEEMN